MLNIPTETKLKIYSNKLGVNENVQKKYSDIK